MPESLPQIQDRIRLWRYAPLLPAVEAGAAALASNDPAAMRTALSELVETVQVASDPRGK